MEIDPGFPDGATPIDAEEVAGLMPSVTTQEQLNQFEALNVAEGATWAERSRALRRDLLDQRSLKLLHKHMFGKTWKWAGAYRITQKNIGCEAWMIPVELKNLSDDVNSWLDYSTYSFEEIAARFHHRLVSIHPFPNGNGRHARLATDLLCRQVGASQPSWGSGDLVSEGEARNAYIEALQAADGNDYGPLIQFIWS